MFLNRSETTIYVFSSRCFELQARSDGTAVQFCRYSVCVCYVGTEAFNRLYQDYKESVALFVEVMVFLCFEECCSQGI